MKNINIPPQIFVYLLITIVVIITLYVVLKRVGLIENLTRKEKQREKETKNELAKEEQSINLANIIISDMQEFNPSYWEKAPKSDLLNEVQARQIAGAINAAFHWYGDDEAAIMRAFKSLSNGYQVSQVSFYYAANYNSDLVYDLLNNLDNEELNSIVKIVKNLS